MEKKKKKFRNQRGRFIECLIIESRLINKKYNIDMKNTIIVSLLFGRNKIQKTNKSLIINKS